MNTKGVKLFNYLGIMGDEVSEDQTDNESAENYTLIHDDKRFDWVPLNRRGSACYTHEDEVEGSTELLMFPSTFNHPDGTVYEWNKVSALFVAKDDATKMLTLAEQKSLTPDE